MSYGKKGFGLLSSVSTVLLATVLSGTASAQDVTDDVTSVDKINRLGVVTVTARKVEENLQDVPVAVTAFSGAELEAKGVESVGDIASFTPGFTTKEASSQPSALVFAIRGQLQNDVLATLDPSVGTYVDEVYWARAYGLNFNLLDMEAVQVLKGPQGTLFGRNTTGGALLFTTADPDLSGPSGRFTGTLGRFNEKTFEGVLNLPVSSKVAVRGAYRSSQRDGYIEDILSGQKYNNRDIQTGRLKVLFAPTDDVELILSADFYEQTSNGSATGTIFATGLSGAYLNGFDPLAGAPIPVAVPNYTGIVLGSDGDRVALDGGPVADTKTETYTAKLNWDIGSGTLKFIASTRSIDASNVLDLDGFAFTSGGALHITEGGQNLDQTSYELQYTDTAFDNRLNYVVGVNYFEESGIDETFTDLRVVPDPIILRFLGDIDNTSIGVYAQGTYDLTDKWSVTAGVRYSEDDKGITTFNGQSVGKTDLFVGCDGGQAPPCTETYSDTFDELSYTFGVDYRVTDNILTYGKFSHGYRAGGQNLRLSGTDDFEFGPEINDEFEIGLKSDLFNNTLRLNLAAYTNEITDAQRSIIIVLPSGSNATVIQNAASLTTTGLEIDALWAPTDNWTFQAAASTLDASYDSYVDAGVDVSDRRIIGVPETELSLAATYEKSLKFGDFTARLDYAWRDSYANNELAPSSPISTPALQDAITSPASDVLNARIGVAFDNGWDVALWGRNILDDRSNVNGLFVSNLGYVNGSFREPVTYGVTASFRFGD